MFGEACLTVDDFPPLSLVLYGAGCRAPVEVFDRPLMTLVCFVPTWSHKNKGERFYHKYTVRIQIHYLETIEIDCKQINKSKESLLERRERKREEKKTLDKQFIYLVMMKSLRTHLEFADDCLLSFSC